MNDTNGTPRGNGKTSSKAEQEAALETPLQLICHDPENRDSPCPICGGKGVYTLDVALDDPRFGKFQRCPNHPAEHDRDMQLRLRRYGNLQAYHDKTFANFLTDLPGGSYTQSVSSSLRSAKTTAQDFADNPRGWIVYEGPFGCGKTHLAVAIANQRLEQFGEQVLFITAPDLLDLLRTTFDPRVEISYDEYFEQIRNVPLLVLDDLGVENPSPWAKEKLFQLLNHRHVEALPTVITTNTSIEDLDPRLGSRMLQGTVVRHIKILAPDYRQVNRPEVDEKSFSNIELYRRMRFENFSTVSVFPEDAANLERALATAAGWAANPEGWLYIMGEYGSGKTHLAAAIAYDLHERGLNVVFTTVPDLLDYLRLAFDPRTNARFDKRFHAIVNAPFLILDDLRLASATAWAKEKLFQIIDYRYLARSPTVITSSESAENTDSRLATRLFDRRVCLPFAMQVPSYIKRSKKQY